MHTSDTVYSDFFVCQKICDNGKKCVFFLFRSVIFAIYQTNSNGKQHWMYNFSVLNILQILNHHKNYPIKGT